MEWLPLDFFDTLEAQLAAIGKLDDTGDQGVITLDADKAVLGPAVCLRPFFRVSYLGSVTPRL